MNSDGEGIPKRVADLATFLTDHDLRSVRIERNNEVFEVARAGTASEVPAPPSRGVTESAAPRIDQVASDRVGIFRLGRPVPFVGEKVEQDRELGYVEQLGIRNPVRSRGAGRIRAILQRDGDIVDYGRPLFELER
jgi:acetyl-CoA carboxylase biotin carboxyl carrier protein